MEYARTHVWDYLRAFTLFVLLIDHGIHAYGLHFNRWHFIADEGAAWADFFYLYDNNIIMPMLFFLGGLFVIPSLKTKSMGNFIKGRLVRLGIPWLVGIPLIVPFLSLPRYLVAYPDLTVKQFLFELYFPDRMQGGGPFWVLWYLLFLTLLVLVLNRFTPVIGVLRKSMEVWVRAPILGTILFTFLVCGLFYASDLYYGAYNWIGFVNFMDAPLYPGDTNWFYHGIKLFKVQGSRYLVQALFFFLGVALGSSSLMHDQSFWHKLAQSWKQWLVFSLASFVVYAAYVSWIFDVNADGLGTLYSSDFAQLLRDDYEGPRFYEAFQQHLEIAAPRLLLQGICLVLTAFAWVSFFHHFCTKSNKVFCAYASSSYGIFLLHEIPMIWMQYGLIGHDIPQILKIIIVLSVGLTSTWAVVLMLKKIPGVVKIL